MREEDRVERAMQLKHTLTTDICCHGFQQLLGKVNLTLGDWLSYRLHSSD